MASSVAFFESAAALGDGLRMEVERVEQLKAKFHSDLEAHLGKCKDNSPRPKEGKASDIFQLNVGGDTSFATRRDTLTALQGSRLAQLFVGHWDARLPRDADGRIFLDFDPVQFRALLGWLVDVKRVGPGSPLPAYPTKTLPHEHRWGFEALCRYLGLDQGSSCSGLGWLLAGKGAAAAESALGSGADSKESADGTGSNVLENMGSLILGQEDLQKLGKLIGNDPAFVDDEHSLCLLYRASRDGFPAQVFHQLCDNRGPTLVIARSVGGYIFGGYSDVAWDSSGQYKTCQKAFLFRLAGPNGPGTSKHTLFQNHQNGIHCNSAHCVSFGGAHDMRIFPEGAAARATFAIGHTYNSAGSGGTTTFLAESQSVVVTDWEVFEVRTLMNCFAAIGSLSTQAASLQKQMQPQAFQLLQQALSVATMALGCFDDLGKQLTQLDLKKQNLESEAAFMRKFFGTDDSGEGQPEIIKLNVSGVRMATFRSTLTQFPGSTLAAKFGSSWTLQDDELVDGGVFVDEDPHLFNVILQHLRFSRALGKDAELDRVHVSAPQRAAFGRMLKYMNMEHAVNVALFDSDILTMGHHPAMCAVVADVSDREPRLLYRASRDGFSAQVFHQLCDSQGPTLVIAQSVGGYIFGGYSDVPWDSSGQWKTCQKAFLFRLAGPNGVGGTSKHMLFQNHQNGIHCHSSHCVSFGGGNDMRIFPEGVAARATFAIGLSYNSAGTGGTSTFLAESQSVAVTDWEVFAL